MSIIFRENRANAGFLFKAGKGAFFLFLTAAVFLLLFIGTSCSGGGGGGGGGSAGPDPVPSPTSTAAETGTITGVVVDEGGVPEKDINVSWGLLETRESGSHTRGGSTVTDSQGQYTLTNVPAGPVIITVFRDTSSGTSFEVTVVPNTTTNAPQAQVEPVGHVEVSVSAGTGGHLQGARVEIQVTGWNNLIVTNNTNNLGICELPYIKVGVHNITASKSGYQSSQSQVSVTAGETTRKEFSLTPVATPTPQPTATVTPTPVPTPTQTVSPSPSPTPTSQPSPSPQPTGTPGNYETVQSTLTVSSGGQNHNFTVYRPNVNLAFPGVLVVNGFNPQQLASKGFYVAYGEPDFTETAIDVVEAMKNQPYCTNKVGATGHSWGGAFVLDLAAKGKNVHGVFEMAGLLVPENNIDLKIDIPNAVYFVTGQNDNLASPAETQAMYNEFVQSGQPAYIYIVPGEGHGYSSAAWNDLMNRAADFFNTYLR